MAANPHQSRGLTDALRVLQRLSKFGPTERRVRRMNVAWTANVGRSGASTTAHSIQDAPVTQDGTDPAAAGDAAGSRSDHG